MNFISELKIREIIRSQLVERYGMLNEQQPPGWTRDQVEEIQNLLIRLYGVEDDPESINALLNVSNGRPDGQWGSSTTSAWNLADADLPEWSNELTYDDALSAITSRGRATAQPSAQSAQASEQPESQEGAESDASMTVGDVVTAWRSSDEVKQRNSLRYARALATILATQGGMARALAAGAQPPLEINVDYRVIVAPEQLFSRVVEEAGLEEGGSGDPNDDTRLRPQSLRFSPEEAPENQYSSSRTFESILYNIGTALTDPEAMNNYAALHTRLRSAALAQETVATLMGEDNPDEEAIVAAQEEAAEDIASAANVAAEGNPAVAEVADDVTSAVQGGTDVDEEPEEPDTASAASTQDEREVSDDIGTSGVGEEARREPLELLTVDDRNGDAAFRIRLPASFVGKFENQRGFVGRIFGSDTLNQFAENPRSTGKDQPFVINWGGYSGAPANTMFGQTTETLGDLQDIGFEEDMGIGRVRGPVKDTFNMVKAQRKAARKAYEDKDKERRRGDATQAQVTAASAEATRLRDLEQFMRGSRYERLRIRRKDGTSQDLFRFTPASRRKEGTPPVTAADLQAIDAINAGRLDSLREASLIKEKILLEKLIRGLIKES